MKSTSHSLIHFLPFPELYRILDKNSLRLTLLQLKSLNFRRQLTVLSWTPLYNHFVRATQKKTASIVKEAYLRITLPSSGRPIVASAGMCLPSRCLAMGIHVTISFYWKTCSVPAPALLKTRKVDHYTKLYRCISMRKGGQPQCSDLRINYIIFNFHCIRRIRCASTIENDPTSGVELYGRRSHTHLIVVYSDLRFSQHWQWRALFSAIRV
jgi:hypothetical protein